METLNTQLAPFAIRFPALVEQLYHNPPGATMAGDSIEATIHNHFAAMSAANHTWKRETFYRLLMVMYGKKCYGVLRNPAYIDVLANISRFGNKTVRPIEDWTKDSLTADGQLASIIRYLFAVYEVPQFMEHVFAESNIVHMLWYIQLGRGDSVLSLCAFPAKFTHKMAHEFRNTPGHVYTIDQAIRRAQALGYGATHKLAENIAWSVNVAEIKDNAFRAKMIQFVAKHARGAQFVEVESVMGYVAEKHGEATGFKLKGRAWAALVKAAREHEVEKAKRLAAEMRGDWKPVAIADYEAVEEMYTYRIVQLVTSEELYEEGREMSHCVADYADDCAEGEIAIFSVRSFNADYDGYYTLATLEYSVTENAIVQAQGRFNENVSAEAEKHILAWTKAEGIDVHCRLYYEYEAPAPIQVPQAAQPVRPQAEMPRIIPRPDPLEVHRQMMARRRNEANNDGFDIDASTLIKVALILIKLLILMSRCH
ncbi:PcfJ domain-containing protein [Flavobacterium sp. RHBU_3]|uniref:PcfJ domain-containing protein n=1 Tax=Flavobacterium sp. RHBU_3 TaxID=3391184 RepID=UPI003984A13F